MVEIMRELGEFIYLDWVWNVWLFQNVREDIAFLSRRLGCSRYVFMALSKVSIFKRNSESYN